MLLRRLLDEDADRAVRVGPLKPESRLSSAALVGGGYVCVEGPAGGGGGVTVSLRYVLVELAVLLVLLVCLLLVLFPLLSFEPFSLPFSFSFSFSRPFSLRVLLVSLLSRALRVSLPSPRSRSRSRPSSSNPCDLNPLVVFVLVYASCTCLGANKIIAVGRRLSSIALGYPPLPDAALTLPRAPFAPELVPGRWALALAVALKAPGGSEGGARVGL
jgi:hypothetical protein